jgi:hypothetical protein
MKLIHPIKITDAHLAYSSVAEADHPAYNGAATYGLGDKVIYGHRRYESLQAGNVGQLPPVAPAYWLDLGPTNRWGMFDGEVGTVTNGGPSLTVTLTPGAIDAVGFVETQAEAVHVVMESNGNIVYDKHATFEAAGKAIENWYDYFFQAVGRKTNLLLDDLPRYSDGILTINLTHESEAKCGVLVVGDRYRLGNTTYKPEIGINDFSLKTTTKYGATTLVEGAWSKKIAVNIQCATFEVDDLLRKLAAVRATACLFVGDGGSDALTVYGFYRSFRIEMAYRDISYCSMNIEGLI